MNLKNWHFNILVGLNSFILFFILFENSLQIPISLQVIGRMHPLLLHFPIVLLMACWLLFLFRRRLQKELPRVNGIINSLLFISALLIAITTILGLLLSREGGYQGDSYHWHKYAGVSLSLLSLCLIGYLHFYRTLTYHPLFAAGINIAMVLLLLTGHFGASLTHGEDFIYAPLIDKESQALDLEYAMVFEDAVLPILQAKCMACHNSSKPKGDLILSDSSSILKGGKNGNLFLAGNPATSLMIQRLLLDIEDQHHMPPKGKTQLSIDEIALLKAWVQSGGKFNVPLIAFGEHDTLFQSVKAVYGFQGPETFDFPAADKELIKKLTTPYRIINPLDATSPALDVNFYGREFYNQESLLALVPIAPQIVSLNLSAMPVKKEDIQTLKKFTNLRSLNLNNTHLSNANILLLSELENLKSISLVGTEIKNDGLIKLTERPSIRSIYVWNTAIKPEEIEALRKKFPTVRIDDGVQLDASQKLALTLPKIDPTRSFFKNKMLVSLAHPISGVQLIYTLDGTSPDSTNALIYQKPFFIEKDIALRVKAVKDNWLPSDEAIRFFHLTTYSPQKIQLECRPHHLYKARKELSLFDLESGGDNHADGKWIGFQGNDFSASLFFDDPVQLNTLALSIKQEYNQHIYPPEYIEVWAGADSLNLKLLGTVQVDLDKADKTQKKRLVSYPIPHEAFRVIRLKTKHYTTIPEGFPGGGSTPWLFVDEIILN